MRTIKSLFCCSVILLIAALNGTTALAENIRVNLIVFTHINSSALQEENFSQVLVQPHPVSNPLQLLPAGSALPPVTSVSLFPSQLDLLPANQLGQDWVVKQLMRAGDQIILNVGWIQPMLPTNRWFHIYGGQAYDASGQPIGSTGGVTTFPSANAAYWELNGALRLSFDRGLVLDTNLYLTTNQGGSTNTSQYGLTPLVSYPLNGTRHMQIGQSAYFDHPLYGVLVMTSPVQ